MDSEEDIRARPLGAERHGGGLGMRMELILSFCGSLSLSLSLSLSCFISLSLSYSSNRKTICSGQFWMSCRRM